MGVMDDLGLPPSDDLDDDENDAPFSIDDNDDVILGANVPTAYTSGKALAAVPAGGKQPAAPQKGAAPSMSEQLFNQAQQLAAKTGRKPTVMDGIMAGLTAQMGKPSRNKAVAFLDALFTSANAGYQARKQKDETKDQFDRTAKLYGMASKLESEKAKAGDRSRRTAAYEASVYGRGGNGKPMTPLQRAQAEKAIAQTVASEFATDLSRLKQEDENPYLPPNKRMPPEERQRILEGIRKRRDELHQGVFGLPPGSNAGTSQAPAAPATTPGPDKVPVPQNRPTKPPPGLPAGVDRNDAIAQTKAALEAARREGNVAKEQAIRERATKQFGLDF